MTAKWAEWRLVSWTPRWKQWPQISRPKHCAEGSSEGADCKTDFHLLHHSGSRRHSLLMNDPMSNYSQLRTHMTALNVCWRGGKLKLCLFCSTCAGVSGVLWGQYLLDVAFNVEWQVEEKLEALQDVECIACGVSFVFPPQDLLEKSICSITRSYERDGQRKREWVKEAGENEKLGYYKNKCWYHISLLMSVSGFLPALCAIWRSRDRAAREKVTAISESDSLVEPLHSELASCVASDVPSNRGRKKNKFF